MGSFWLAQMNLWGSVHSDQHKVRFQSQLDPKTSFWTEQKNTGLKREPFSASWGDYEVWPNLDLNLLTYKFFHNL